MRNESGFADKRLLEALDYIDMRFIEEAAQKIKERPIGYAPSDARTSRKVIARQILKLAACLLILSAAIPVITYVLRNFTELAGLFTGDTTEETAPELTEPETPPPETSAPAPETSENTVNETTAPLYDGTTAEPEVEYDGSRGLMYKMNDDGKSYYLAGMGICTDENIVVASTYDGYPVTVIGKEALAGYDRVKSVTIPDSVTVIDHYAFMNCSALENVTIPDKVTYIGAEAFSGTAIKNIELPTGLTYLSIGAFKDCPIEEVMIPYTVEVVYSAFWGCSELRSVTIGRNVAEIKALAFYGCSKLTGLNFDGTVEEWNKIKKNEDWNAESVISVVHCTDGDVAIEPDETTECAHSEYTATENMPTCTESATVYCSCLACGYGWSEIMPPLGHNYVNNICTRCGAEIEYDGSRGLEYKISDDGKYAALVGIGTCTDKDIVTATMYNGLPVTEIWYNAFVGVKGLTSVTISEGITYLYSCAFENCPDLKAVYLPSTLGVLEKGEAHAFYECDNIEIITVAKDNPKFYSVDNCVIEKATGELVFACSKSVLPTDGSIKSIGEFAFGGSDSLEKIVIPEGVTVIHPYAFAGCASLKSVTFPDSLTTIRWNAFANCTSLESVKLGDNVTEIGSRVFSGCSSLADITLPKRVDSFGEEIFSGCAIESIVIPDGVKNLNGGMFVNCKKLKNVTLPDGIETIVSFAFGYCSSLEKITLPRSVTKIDGEVFADCSNLTEFTFKGTKAEWKAIEKQDGWNRNCPFTVIHCSDGDVEVNEYDGSRGLEYKIGDDGKYAILVGIGTCTDNDIAVASTYNGLPVKVIGEMALFYENINSVRVSDTVEIIEEEALGGGKYISLYISSSVRQLEGAFSTCGRLESIIVDDKNPIYRSVDNCLINKETKTLVLGCKNSIIPADGSVTVIGKKAFETARFTEITIPKGIIEIGEEAFAWCMMLESIVIPDSVKIIGDSAFMDCERAKTLKLGKGVESIADGAFYYCIMISEVELPVGLKTLGSNVFGNCRSLKNIVIPEGVKFDKPDGGVLSSMDMESVTLPSTMERIGNGFFFGCGYLKSVDIPGDVKSIGGEAFQLCKSLSAISIPAGVTEIGEKAFDGCTKLSSFTFEGTVAEWNAVKKGDGWNEGCPFTKVVCSDGEVDLFDYDGSLWLEYSIVGDYAVLEGIGSCPDTDIVVASHYKGYPVRVIDQWAFGNNTRIKSVKISDTVTRIGHRAFSGCTSLESIYIPASVNEIDGMAFYKCPNITSIVIDPENPTYEGENCIIEKKNKRLFVGCRTTVIPSDGSVTYIDGYAFYKISGITSVTIPEGIIDMCEFAFTSCPDLREVHLPSTLISLYGGEGIAFDNCDNIEVITVAANNPKFYSSGNCVIERDTGSLVFGCAASVIPNDGSVKIIDHYAFGRSKKLTNIVIPEGVTEIRQGAFVSCTNLKEVSFPKSLTKIDWWAFENCISLESALLGDNVTYIGSGAFRSCTSLESVTLPKTLKSLGEDAFQNCAILTDLRFEGTLAEWNAMEKEDGWNSGCPFTVIHCSDGDVVLN